MSILALTSNTLAGTAGAGQIEYNGQFYATDSAGLRGQVERLVQGTAVASTSGTSILFTGIPAWAKKITIMLSGVSTNSTGIVQVQLGISGGLTTTGYLGAASELVQAGTSTPVSNFSTGFMLSQQGNATYTRHGLMIITNVTGNTWAESSVIGNSDVARITHGGGSIALSGTLTQLAINTGVGTDTFDAGSINIMYEG